MSSKSKQKPEIIGSSGHTVYSLAATKNNKLLYVGLDHKNIKVFDLLKGKLKSREVWLTWNLTLDDWEIWEVTRRRAGGAFIDCLPRAAFARRVDSFFSKQRPDDHRLGNQKGKKLGNIKGPHGVGLYAQAVTRLEVPLLRKLRQLDHQMGHWGHEHCRRLSRFLHISHVHDLFSQGSLFVHYRRRR